MSAPGTTDKWFSSGKTYEVVWRPASFCVSSMDASAFASPIMSSPMNAFVSNPPTEMNTRARTLPKRVRNVAACFIGA